VISGFVITQVIWRQIHEPEGFSLSVFYRRRFKRLLPALAFMITIIAIISTLVLPLEGSLKKSLITGIGASTFSANWVLHKSTGGYFDLPSESNAMLHTWSLSIEGQFYFIFPIALLFLFRKSRSKGDPVKTLLNPILILASLSFILFLVAATHKFDTQLTAGQHLFYNPLPRAWEFLFGSIAALLIEKSKSAGLVCKEKSLTLPIVILVLSFIVMDKEWAWPNAWVLVPVFTTSYILRFGFTGKGIGHLVLSSKILGFIGDRSYSFYLWHWPVIVLCRAVWTNSFFVNLCAVLLSFAVAHLSFLYLENPIRKRSERGAREDWILVFKAISAPVAVSALILIASLIAPKTGTEIKIANEVTPSHIGRNLGCHLDTPIENREMKNCIWGMELDNPVYLFGDSQADQFTEAFKEVSKFRKTVVATISGCPININVRLFDSSTRRVDEGRCRKFSDSFLRYLANSPRGTVVIAGSDQYWRESNFALLNGEGKEARLQTLKLKWAASALEDFARRIKILGFQVIIVETIPQFNYEPGNPKSKAIPWSPLTCSRLKILNGKCFLSMSLLDAKIVQGPSWKMSSQIAKDLDIGYLSLQSEICPGGSCKTYSRGGHWIYRDGSHISVWMSEALAPWFVSALKN
jgi:peptidoglycan/LPS O-acetylase OafA/YrhL